MMLYTISIAIHVVVAVLAIGLVGAIPITARVARHADALAGTDAVLGTVLRAVQLGLAAMLVTGVLLDTAVGGAYHSTGWFRASGVLFLAIAAAVGFARIAFRRSGAPGVTRRDALARVERWGWVASVLVALVTIVMRTKPLA